jgi:hypothetical protein
VSAKRTIAILAAVACSLPWPAIARAEPEGIVHFGQITVGPTGLDNLGWQIDNAQGVPGPVPDSNNQVSGWTIIRVEKQKPTDTGNLIWAATSAPGSQFNMALQTLLNPTTVGNDIQGPMDGFHHQIGSTNNPPNGNDGDQTFFWPLFSWTGTYSGPTDDTSLTSTVLLDTTNFVNPHPGTFGFHLDLVGDGTHRFIDLVYTAPIPEPGTFVLTGLGLLAAWRFRGRRSQAVPFGSCLARTR